MSYICEVEFSELPTGCDKVEFRPCEYGEFVYGSMTRSWFKASNRTAISVFVATKKMYKLEVELDYDDMTKLAEMLKKCPNLNIEKLDDALVKMGF